MENLIKAFCKFKLILSSFLGLKGLNNLPTGVLFKDPPIFLIEELFIKLFFYHYDCFLEISLSKFFNSDLTLFTLLFLKERRSL